MSEVTEIKKVETQEAERIKQAGEDARERISRAEADASFRVGEAKKETKEILKEIETRGREDTLKEVAFIRKENTENNNKVLQMESGRIQEAVSFISEKLA